MRKQSILSLLLTMFLVIALLPAPNTAHASGTPTLPILLGSYTSTSLQVTGTGVDELTSFDNWLTSNGASGLTFAGDFVSITFNPSWNIPTELNAAWNAGFVPFVNLMPSESWESLYGPYYDSNCDTAADIAAGLCDAKLTSVANLFKTWAGSTKRAFIAPMPEMNGSWTAYSSDGATYKQAFLRIRSLFESAGVPRSAVRWVFAPNGWNSPLESWRQFENFYPGDDYVDVVSFSAYNYGGCPNQYAVWDTFETAIKPYLDRMRVMAPSKPIFIAQTGVVGVPFNAGDPTQTKSAWVQDTFSKLANYPAVRAIIYFNKINPNENVGSCVNPDYRIYYGSSGEAGLLTMMQDARFGKWSTASANWDSIGFAESTYTFSDVRPSHPFSGEANIWYYTDVHKLYNNGVTSGCNVSPLRYCPDSSVTRAQMAVFLLKSKYGQAYVPPSVGGSTGFADVPTSHWAAAWIKQLAAEGITSGCGSGNYCPESSVTREQMAVFLLRSKYSGVSYTPPAVGAGTGFSDVPVSHLYAAWIKQLAAEGITSGCGAGTYCPGTAVTRAQMAIFLVRTFSLP